MRRLLVTSYAAQFNHALVVNFGGSTDIMLGSLARRIFLSSDPTPADQFDDKVPPGISIADAARLISGLLSIDLDNNEARLFLNPRATHPITKCHVEQMFKLHKLPRLGIESSPYQQRDL